MAEFAGQQGNNFLTIGFCQVNPFTVCRDKSGEILASCALQHFGGFNRNRQWIVDDIGPLRQAVKALLLGNEAVRTRHQRCFDFSVEQHFKGVLIGAEQVQFDVAVYLKMGKPVKRFGKRHAARWALTTCNGLTLEILE